MLDLFAVPLVATLLLAPEPPAAVPLEASAAVPAPTPTAALLDAPELWLGETRVATIQYCREVEDWNPFLTRFDPAAYRCVEAWGDEQWLWIEEEYDSPALRFFVRRGTLEDRLFEKARAHDRFEVELVVQEMHAGRSWVELTSARWTEQQTPEGTVIHVIRALDMVEREGWTLASSELQRALRPNLPGHVRRELETIKASVDETVAADESE